MRALSVIFLTIGILYLLLLFLPITDHERIEGFASKEWCEKLIELMEKEEIGLSPEDVDGKPEYQLDFIGKVDHISSIWDFIQETKFSLIQSAIFKKHGFRVSKDHTFGFVRRYRPGERLGIGPHTDTTLYTATILLSDTHDFDGGDLFVFDKFRTSFLRLFPQRPRMTRFLELALGLHPPIVDFEQGDLLFFTGNENGGNTHGTVPLRSGTRYVLVFFFPSKQEFDT